MKLEEEAMSLEQKGRHAEVGGGWGVRMGVGPVLPKSPMTKD